MKNPLRILHVEDSLKDAELVENMLRQEGIVCEVLRVDTRADYVSALEQRTFDLIMGDYSMPGFDGLSALKIAQEKCPDVPFIFVSGTLGEDIAIEALKHGAVDYVLKDRLTRLVTCVRRALREVEEQRERKRAQEGLRESEARKKAMLEGALDTIIAIDHQGKILEFNPAAERTFGYTLDQVIGKPMAELIIPSHLREKHKQGLKQYIATGEGPFIGKVVEVTAMRADGTEFPAELAITSIGEKWPPMFLGHLRDITERKQAQEEVQRNLERIRALHEIDVAISSTLDLQAVLDVLLEKIDQFFPYPTATTVRLFNRATRQLESLACRGIDEKEWKAQQRTSLGSRGMKLMETKAPLTVRDIHSDPRTYNPAVFRGLVSYLGVPLIIRDEVLGTLSLYTKQEHEFSKEEVDFLVTLAGQAAIAIHNAQLYEQMAKANKIKDEFLSVMSHELRTPLNVVVGYTGMIMDGMLGEVNEQQKEALEKVIRRTNDQLVLVNNILYATVLESEGVNVESHDFNLEDFLNQLKLDYEAPINRELSLNWDYPFGLPNIRTDSAKLKHILRNLIDNAIKFTAKGSITVSARISDQPTQNSKLKTQNFQQWVEFKVADTGVGIPKEHLPHIFDKFRQADSSETRSFGGVGMGLYIARKFTELLGGTVEVESEPGKGSSFTVRLPVA